MPEIPGDPPAAEVSPDPRRDRFKRIGTNPAIRAPLRAHFLKEVGCERRDSSLKTKKSPNLVKNSRA